MWDDNKQRRFSVLWERKFNGTLTQLEQTELDNLIDELDRLECDMLQPAFKRLDEEYKQVATQNSMIESLLKERNQLLNHAMNQIQQLLQEHVQLKVKTASVINDLEISHAESR